LREQLARAAYKRDALLVFVGARAFPHKDQRRMFVAHSEDQLVAPLMQPAPLAIADVL
jgi:hypothetical protein